MSRMNFADVAEDVLRRAAGGPLHFKEITQRATDDGLISPKSTQPWVYMAEAINADIRRRSARGDRPRFRSAGRGYFRLTAPSSAPEAAVNAWNEQNKTKVLTRLAETEPSRFEEIVGKLLTVIGFDDIEITSRTKDGGVDVRGLLTVGGITQVSTAIEVKRYTRRNVGAPTVRGLRGGLGPKEQGLIVTLSDFTADAKTEASIPDRAPITLINGKQLVELLAEHRLGFNPREVLILDVDESAFIDQTDSEEDDEREPVVKGQRLSSTSTSPRTLFKLQGGPKNYINALIILLEHASNQPTVDEFLDRLQASFPQITVRDVARRHMGVPLSLGFARIQGDRIALTPEGNAFLTSRNPQMVRNAIVARIPGAGEIAPLVGTVKDPSTVHKELESKGISITLTQVKRISQWLRQTE